MLSHVAPARMFEEVLKLFISGAGAATFKEMQRLHLFGELFPLVQPLLTNEQGREYRFLLKVLENTDNRINTGLRITPAFFYAAVLWYVVEERCQQHVFEGGFSHHDAFHLAMNDVLLQQSSRIAIPKRFSSVMRDIWLLQHRLPKRFGKRAYQLLEHPKFRAAYDFLMLRAQAGEEVQELVDWWTEFQIENSDLLANLASRRSTSRSRRKNSKKRSHQPNK